MSDQYLGEIRVFANTYAPKGWATCQGQTVPIAQNTALFSLLGASYGGDGRSTFALPNLQGQVPISAGQSAGGSQYAVGQAGGVAGVTLTQATLPSHNHSLNANTGDGAGVASAGAQLSKAATGGRESQTTANVYNPTTPNTAMSAATLGPAGSGQAHNNMQPYLPLNYCIALQGVFPSRP